MTEVFLENSGKIITLDKIFNYHKLHLGDYIVAYESKGSKLNCYKLICFIHTGNRTLPVVEKIIFGGFINYVQNYMKYIENLK